MNSFIAWLHWGVQPQNESTLNRKILHTNIAAFVSVLSLFFYQLLFLKVGKGLITLAPLMAIPYEIALLLIPLINRMGKDGLARWTLATCAILYLSLTIVFECGSYINTEIYYLLFAIVPSLFFPTKQWRSILFLFILNLALYLYFKFNPIEPHAGILAMDPALVGYLRSSFPVSTFLTMFAFVWLKEVTSEINETKLEHALTESRQIQQRLSMATEVTQILFWELDVSTSKLIYDHSMLPRLGLEADDGFNTLPELLSRVHPDDQVSLQTSITDAIQQNGFALNCEYRISNWAGEYRWIQTRGRVVEWAADGSPLFAVGTSINIDTRKQAEQIIRDSEERYRNLASMLRLMCDNVPDMIWAKDLNHRYIFANKTMCDLLNASDTEEPIGKTDMFFAQRERESKPHVTEWHTFGELCQNTDVITLDKGHHSTFEESGNVKGQYLVLDVHKSPFYNESGEVIGTVGSARDITDRKHAEKHLDYIAHYDSLTALPNRLLLSDRMRQAITQTQRHQQQLAIAYLDLDGFKHVNDQYGHDIGDRLLAIIATRMRETLREGDTLARLGGDEFVAVLLDLPDMAASYPMLTRLLVAAAQSVAIDEHILQISASLGVTFYPQARDGDADVDADQLLRQADQAMYQAKLAGKNRYHIFDTVRDRSVRGYHESLEQIAKALDAGQFVLHFQPEINMRSGDIIGVEALIRWQHPERGMLPPAAFLPVIEGHSFAVDIGEWVIDNALTRLEQWDAAGLNIRVSVNVSAFQLQQTNFVDRLRSILSKHPEVSPARLVLEVLESSAIEDIIHVSQVINDCRHFGVTFALDDFGTGYSSLTYLRRLPVDIIKIDQSFVQDMLRDAEDMAIIEGVLSLANAFGRMVIAEGVESLEQGATLLRLGCDMAQGYAIARPMPGAELPAWAADWHKDPSWRRIRSAPD